MPDTYAYLAIIVAMVVVSSGRKIEDIYMYGGGAHAIVVDMDSVVDYIEEHFGNLKLIIVGHSMGSLAARAYVKKHGERFDERVLIRMSAEYLLRIPVVHSRFLLIVLLP